MDEFAINAKILIAQIINFSVILFVLAKFAYKPVLAMFDERSKKISKGLEDAEAAKKALENSESKAKEIEAKAYAEADKIIIEAKGEAKRSAELMVKKAEDQASKILASAEAEAKVAKDKALASAREHIGSLIMLAVEKVVGEDLEPAQRDRITTKTMKEL